ncbi:glycosyltransferase family 2 protein [Aquimarina rubra]|uniref:Glycosyltransferase family 2 protein n=1 Tax=Aquimarina rubra TaxID=1920033 RepID=A0ABW5LDL7_9FLAO
MVKLSAVIITYNEEKKIERCLSSLVGVVDEIVVIDSFSTDKTEEICKQFDVKFIKQQFLGYIEQKNFAITQASYDHIISLDGDEALSCELQDSLIQLKSNWKYDGYYMNRYNNFCGQWIKHSDWYPDKKLRAFIKGKGEWQGINPHDSFKLTNPKTASKLQGDILHWNYATYQEFNLKTDKFSTISAHSYYELGKKAPIWKIILNPTWAFFKAYFLRLGFLDGFNGFVICVQTANITFLKYSKLRELIKNNKPSN